MVDVNNRLGSWHQRYPRTPHERSAYDSARIIPDDTFLQGPALRQGPAEKPRNALADRAREHGLSGLSDRLNDRSSGIGLAADLVGGLYDTLIEQPVKSWSNMYDAAHRVEMPSAEDSFNVAGAAMLGGMAVPKPANAVGIFGGRLANTADNVAAQRVYNRLESMGYDVKRNPSAQLRPDGTLISDGPVYTIDFYANGGKAGAATGAAVNSRHTRAWQDIGRMVDDEPWNVLDAIRKAADMKPTSTPHQAYRGSMHAELPPNGPVWGSSNPNVASSYADLSLSDTASMMPLEFRFKNPMTINAAGSTSTHVPFRGSVATTDEIARHALENGHDGVMFKRLRDTSDGANGPLQTTYAALKPGTTYSQLTGEMLYANGSPLTNALAGYYGQQQRHDWSENLPEGVI